MKLNKVAFAVASALAIASGVAHAGQIQASSAMIAKDVIKSDAQALIAPATTYTFAGDVNAQPNSQGFQLQYILKSGTWAVGSGNTIAAVDTLTAVALDLQSGAGVLPALTATADDLLQVNYTDGANVPKTAFPAGTVVTAFVNAAKTALVFNVAIPQGAGPEFFLKNPRFTVNPPTTNVKINGLYSLVGLVDCAPDTVNVNMEFKHALSNPGTATVLVGTAAEGAEHLRGGAANEALMLSFVENVKITFTQASTSSRTTASSLNTVLFDVDGSAGAPIQGNFTNAASVGFTGNVMTGLPAGTPAGGRHYLGHVKISLMAAGKDLDYSTTYGSAFSDTGVATVGGAVDLDTTKGVNVTLTLPQALPTGSVINIYNAAGTVIIASSTATTAGQSTVSISATSAAAATALLAGGFVFVDFPGTTVAGMIPNIGNIAVKGTIHKLNGSPVTATNVSNEQDNMCVGNFTGLGGGIKIDVRNYASFKSFGNSGVGTTVRLINNSESNAADVYGQMIYADGTYGAWGKLADLKPREATNMSNKEIEALLVNAPAATNPFGTGTVYTQTAGTAVVTGPKAGTGDRLRIVSSTGSTLRVQSYMVVGNMVLDTSNAQGVDFEGTANDRTPTTAIDAQPVSQDAINGLSK
jgi:hypothetical protein